MTILPPLGATERLALPVVGALGLVGRALGLFVGAGGFLLIVVVGPVRLAGPVVGAFGLAPSRIDGLVPGRWGAGGLTKTGGGPTRGILFSCGVTVFGPVGVVGPVAGRWGAGGFTKTVGGCPEFVPLLEFGWAAGGVP